MNEALNPLNRSQVTLEGLEVERVEPDGAHRDAYRSIAGCLRRTLDLLQDLWSAESPVLDRSTHGNLLGLARQRDAATAVNCCVKHIVRNSYYIGQGLLWVGSDEAFGGERCSAAQSRLCC